ncbi:hypothetical protein L5515_009121 [Caenorhabditis briggsae]|uniref:Uncharacterized protein n=1 Tax=Caenorhabditis briggsae TaxID=6238 RepID=A0AAE9JML3_CAEBR|nr:hypothetical protein L5515_009121 [Caenorhabditis briggsae]
MMSKMQEDLVYMGPKIDPIANASASTTERLENQSHQVARAFNDKFSHNGEPGLHRTEGFYCKNVKCGDGKCGDKEPEREQRRDSDVNNKEI